MTPLLIGESRAEEAGPGGRPRGQGSPQAIRPAQERVVQRQRQAWTGSVPRSSRRRPPQEDPPAPGGLRRAAVEQQQVSANVARRTWLGPPVGSPSPGDTAMHRPAPDRMREPWESRSNRCMAESEHARRYSCAGVSVPSASMHRSCAGMERLPGPGWFTANISSSAPGLQVWAIRADRRFRLAPKAGTSTQ